MPDTLSNNSPTGTEKVNKQLNEKYDSYHNCGLTFNLHHWRKILGHYLNKTKTIFVNTEQLGSARFLNYLYKPAVSFITRITLPVLSINYIILTYL